jgi:hypothetical protein
MTNEVDEFFSHYGVKGMHWGVRKIENSGTNTSRSAEETSAIRKARAKKVAIGAGVLAVAAGTAYVGYTLHKNGKLPLKSLKTSVSAKKATESILTEPTDVIHATRGRDVGFQFFKRGGTPSFFSEYAEAGFNENQSGDYFHQYGSKVAARFADPEGRRDFAGRTIIHEVIVPSSMSSGINSLDDVTSKIWPILKPDYDVFYKTPGSVARSLH